MNRNLFKVIFVLILCMFGSIAFAADTVQIDGVSDMITSGQSLLKVFAKWGGIMTIVGAALALGTGRLEGALAHTGTTLN